MMLGVMLAIHNVYNDHGSCPFVQIKFKVFSRTFKDHMKDIYGELN